MEEVDYTDQYEYGGDDHPTELPVAAHILTEHLTDVFGESSYACKDTITIYFRDLTQPATKTS